MGGLVCVDSVKAEEGKIRTTSRENNYHYLHECCGLANSKQP
jgi:hypothetical protein